MVAVLLLMLWLLWAAAARREEQQFCRSAGLGCRHGGGPAKGTRPADTWGLVEAHGNNGGDPGAGSGCWKGARPGARARRERRCGWELLGLGEISLDLDMVEI